MGFRGSSRKIRQNGENFVKKDAKRVKTPNFGPIDFTQSDSYLTIGLATFTFKSRFFILHLSWFIGKPVPESKISKAWTL